MIVVVTGLPRSGTSLMMQMLQAGGLPLLVDAERPADESNPRGYLEYAPVKALARGAGWIDEAEGRAVKVVAPLLPYLPSDRTYRVVWMDRDLDEVLASQQQMLARLGRPSGDPALLRPAFEAQLRRARAWLAACPTADACDVRHAAVLADPRAEAERVAAFLGGGLDAAAMAAVVDPHLYRERRAG